MLCKGTCYTCYISIFFFCFICTRITVSHVHTCSRFGTGSSFWRLRRNFLIRACRAESYLGPNTVGKIFWRIKRKVFITFHKILQSPFQATTDLESFIKTIIQSIRRHLTNLNKIKQHKMLRSWLLIKDLKNQNI